MVLWTLSAKPEKLVSDWILSRYQDLGVSVAKDLEHIYQYLSHCLRAIIHSSPTSSPSRPQEIHEEVTKFEEVVQANTWAPSIDTPLLTNDTPPPPVTSDTHPPFHQASTGYVLEQLNTTRLHLLAVFMWRKSRNSCLSLQFPTVFLVPFKSGLILFLLLSLYYYSW